MPKGAGSASCHAKPADVSALPMCCAKHDPVVRVLSVGAMANFGVQRSATVPCDLAARTTEVRQ